MLFHLVLQTIGLKLSSVQFLLEHYGIARINDLFSFRSSVVNEEFQVCEEISLTTLERKESLSLRAMLSISISLCIEHHCKK